MVQNNLPTRITVHHSSGHVQGHSRLNALLISGEGEGQVFVCGGGGGGINLTRAGCTDLITISVKVSILGGH